MQRLLVPVLLALAGGLQAADKPVPNAPFAIPGPGGNQFVVLHTRSEDPQAVRGWWPQQRMHEIASLYSVRIEAQQAGRASVTVWSFPILVRAAEPQSVFRPLDGFVEDYVLWLLSIEGPDIFVRTFTLNGTRAESAVLSGWGSLTSPVPIAPELAKARFVRENGVCQIETEDRQAPGVVTRSRFAVSLNRSGQLTVELLSREMQQEAGGK